MQHNIPYIVGIVGSLILLAFWKVSYPYSSWAWLFPLVIHAFITFGRYEYLIRYRQCRAKCVLKESSTLFKWATRKPLVFLQALIMATTYSLPLALFSALASIADVMFILMASLLTRLFYPVSSRMSERHVTEAMTGIMTKQFVVRVAVLIMAVLYSVISYQFIVVPDYLDLSSLKQTMDNASQQVASLCLTTNMLLKWAQEFEAATWYFMISGTQNSDMDKGNFVAWIIFFLSHTLVFAALARLQVELITHAMQKLTIRATVNE